MYAAMYADRVDASRTVARWWWVYFRLRNWRSGVWAFCIRRRGQKPALN